MDYTSELSLFSIFILVHSCNTGPGGGWFTDWSSMDQILFTKRKVKSSEPKF